MAIFQKSVINKHLTNLDKEQVEKAYLKFKENYSLAKIEKIKQLKEEEYQDGFLRDLFVDVFGYTLKPDDNYNLAREFKNQADGKKADGAIIDNNGVNPVALAVIELKSTKTKDFKNVTEQAFGYKSNQPECKYVIISNFQKLRFYVDYANEYEEFDLFHLNKEDFELLYLILKKESIFSNLPLKLKEETKFHEQEVSGKLYKDYSHFKRKLFENLTKNHPESDKLTLFKKSQKLIDRFLFVLFAEDSGLLPPNSISRIIDTYHKLTELDAYKPIYDIYKQYFGYMNIGRKGKTNADNIPAYNGGLFFTDDLLDNLKIDDEILIDDLLRLSEYDFNTEVDVNILGHIFEHSLSEIEEITAELSATADTRRHVPLTSKRKKEGVFYTPKYITQYIVENTIGTLCNEKRKELEIEEIEFDGTYKTKDGKLSAKGKKLYQKLKDYKDWLLSLKIVDPACGSGAFLNQALNFLIQEHKNIDDIIAELTNSPLRLFDVDKTILENNLYGVDINEESVEIAKLSLWLRTAQKGRKLSVLSNNIKCGNSLIDDPEVAGDKAFDWNKEFPQVFSKKEKKAWHITTATHNSRYSQRMFDNHVKPGEAIWIWEKDEIIVTETIADIINEDNLNVVAYNICGDHMHMLLVCEKEEMPKIAGKLKAVSGRKYNIEKGITRGHVPLSSSVSSSISSDTLSWEDTDRKGESEKKKYNSLWTQKFGKRKITDDNDLRNVINYIRNNRQKHELPENKKLEKIIIEMTCSIEHAFHPEYKGGFDVVIGNPPYVSISTLPKPVHHYFEKDYGEIHTGYNDLMYYFLYMGIRILKEQGIFGMITSNYFIGNEYAKSLRGFLSNHISEILNFGDYQVFEDANVHTAIIFAEKDQRSKTVKYSGLIDAKERLLSIDPIRFDTIKKERNTLQEYWIFASKDENKIIEKLLSRGKLLGEISEIEKGSTSGKNDVFTISKEVVKKYGLEIELLRKNVKNGDIIKYGIYDRETYLIYTDNNTEIDKYPNTLNYLKEHQEVLAKRNEVKKGSYDWWRLERPRRKEIYDAKEKIIVPYRAANNRFAYDNERRFNDGGDIRVLLITDKDLLVKYVLGILNSKVIDWYYGFIGKPKGSSREYFNEPLAKIPIFLADNITQTSIAELVDSITKQIEEEQSINRKFFKYLQSQFRIEKLSKKLQNWHELEFGDFIKELNKGIKKVGGKKLSKMDEMEWMEVFETKKTEAQSLKAEIEKIDKEIDQMVYKLYGLSEEEIKIVEGLIK